MNISIWNMDAQFWPKASRDYVFLAAAFHEVGKRLSGDEWTGNEALPVTWPFRDAWRQWENSKRLAKLPTPPRSLADWNSSPPPKVELPKPDPAKVAELDALHAERVLSEQGANKATVERRYKAASWIADLGRNGDLPTFGVARSLEPQPLAPSIWNGGDDWALFAECETKRWLSQQSGPVTLTLFVSRVSLDERLAEVRSPARARKARAGSLKVADAKLHERMRAMIEAGEASGPHQASFKLAGEAEGSATMENKAKRLERGYGERYG